MSGRGAPCVSLFYVIDTGSIGSRIRRPDVRDVSGKVSGVVKTVFC